MKVALGALLQYSPVLALLLAYTITVSLAGVAFLSSVRFAPRDAGLGERLGLALVVGQGVVGTLWQLLATAAMFSLWPVLIGIIVIGLAGLVACLRDPSTWVPRTTTWRLPPFTAATVVMAASVALMALNFILSFLPPGTDAMAFYISQPKLIAATGAFVPLPSYEAFAQIGLAAEMHYGAFFILGGEHVGELAGKAFVWVTAAASLVILSGLARIAGLDLLARAVAVAIAVSGTAFTLVLWDGKTDLIPNACALAAIYAVLQSSTRPGRSAVTGLAAGIACVGKLSFIPSFGVSLTILFLHRDILCAQDWGRVVRAATAIAAWFILPFVALCLKNAVGYGEPFAPFLVFHVGPRAELDQVWFSPENTRWIISTYPLALTFGQYPMQHGNLGVPVLAALPFLLIPTVRRAAGPTAVWMAAAGLAGVLAWVILRPSVLAPRYVLPCLFLLAPACAGVVAWMWRHGGRSARAAMSTSALALFLLQAADAQAMIADNRYYLLALPRTSTHPIWRTADAANTSPRNYVRVMNLMYYSSMYRPNVLACMKAIDVRELKSISKTSRQFWEWAYNHGITHVSFDRLTHAPLLGAPLDPAETPEWLVVRETRFTDRFSSFELVAAPGAPRQDETCNSVFAMGSKKGIAQ